MDQSFLNDSVAVAKIVAEFRSGLAWQRQRLLQMEATVEHVIKLAEIYPSAIDRFNCYKIGRRSAELRTLLAEQGVAVPWDSPIPKLHDLAMARYGRILG